METDENEIEGPRPPKSNSSKSRPNSKANWQRTNPGVLPNHFGTGRPTKFTPENRQKIIAAIKACNYTKVAAAAAGVSLPTLYDWLRQGRAAAAKLDEGLEISEHEQEFFQFACDIAQAEAEAEVRIITHVAAQAATDWRAGMKLLALRHANRWGQPEQATEIPIDTTGVLEGRPDDEGILALQKQLALRAAQDTDSKIVDAEIVEE